MKKKRDITILNRQNHFRININYYKKFISSLMMKLAPEADEVSLLLTNNAEIRKWNATFKGLQKATDVLSFPAGDRNLEGKRNLGDIIISVQRARSQAKEAGCTIKKEIERLIVHGFLHLLGYQHKDRDMKKWEEQLLKKATIKK